MFVVYVVVTECKERKMNQRVLGHSEQRVSNMPAAVYIKMPESDATSKD